VSGDGPFNRQLFITMTPQQQLQWLNGVRERRLAAVREYQQRIAKMREEKRARMTEKLTKAFVAMEKAYAKFEEASAKLDARITALHALIAMVENEEQ